MATKDTVYIDIDEDITSVINKMQSSGDKVVALVLPKRATVFQSTINMKLLKKAAATAKKSIVLITSDTSILPLAGAARLHVAKSLQSKPSIPPEPHVSAASSVITSDELSAGDTVAVPSESSAAAGTLTDDVIELDNTDKAPKIDPVDGAVKTPKNRKLMVPNFNRFRVKVFLGILAVILIVFGWFFGYVVLPKAKITIRTDATTSPVSVQFVATTDAKAVDAEKGLIPAKLAESKKTDSEKVTATGKQDQGTKASGTISLKNCAKTDDGYTIPAGTTASTGSYNFITQSDIALPASNFTGSNKCITATRDVDVLAQNAGGDSNLNSGRSYSIAGFADVEATGGAMGGGTSKIVVIVSQDDINNAESKLTGRQKSAAVGELEAQLNGDGGFALDQTLDEGAPAFTATTPVGQPAADVTVSAVTDYKMLGISSKDLKTVVEASITKSITNSKEKILSNGLDNKVIQLASKKSANEQTLSLSTTATVGPDIDTAAIARDAAGKKRGDIVSSLTSRDDIKDVTITYSPFWVLQTPKKASKISVVIDQADGK